MTTLLAFGLAIVLWAGLHFAYRAWEFPSAQPPMDREAFRSSIPSARENEGGQKLAEALGEMRDPAIRREVWLEKMAEAARLPLGYLDGAVPSGDAPVLRHLDAAGEMAEIQLQLARAQPLQAVDHLSQVLYLSRTLRNKAPIASYALGMSLETRAIDGFHAWLTLPSAPGRLRPALEALNRHVKETPPPLDCVRTECYRTEGNLDNPSAWSFASRTAPGHVQERWLVGGIAFSLDVPWEAYRSKKLYRLVWAGLFRAVDRPYWEMPLAASEPVGTKETTRRVLRGWVPAEGSRLTHERLAAWLDQSWLADDRLFSDITPLRTATRARWRVESLRLCVALALYREHENKTAGRLEDLVPRYLPELPIDPYTGKTFGYRISRGEKIDRLEAQAGQGVLWSAGADRVDDGGRRQGAGWADDESPWWDTPRREIDLITLAPR